MIRSIKDGTDKIYIHYTEGIFETINIFATDIYYCLIMRYALVLSDTR